VLPGNDGNALSACFANWPRLSQPVADGQTALDSLVRVIGAGQPPRSIPSDEKSAPALSHAARLAGDHLRLAARKSATAIRDAILALLDAPGDGLAAACECAGDALWRVNALAAEWTQVLKNVQTERQRASREFRVVAAPPDGPRNQTPDSSKETNRSRSGQELLLGFLDEAFRSNMEYLDHVRRALAGGGDVLVRIRERLGQLGSAFGAGSTESAGDEPSLSVDVEQLERRIRDAGEFKVSALLDNDCALPALADALRRGALEFLAVRASLAAMEAAHGPKASPPSPGGQSSMATRLENLGGGRRLLALLPDEDSAARWKEKLTESFGDCVAVGSSERGPLFLLIELEDVLLERMLGRLTHRHPHLVEVASRLHTRVDIDW